MTPISFYNGVVRHRRLSKPSHALNYNVRYVLVDVDRLAEVKRTSLFFRAGLICVDPKDHGDGKSTDLASWLRSTLKRQGVKEDAAKIELFAMPRVFGFVFNPISVYFISGRDGRPHHILYEVNNTFGGRHFYLVEADAGKRAQKHRCDKAFYVSPFFDIDGFYDFRTTVPERDFTLGIAYRDNNSKPKLNAVFSGKRVAVSDQSCLTTLLRYPLMTVGVVAAIHWHAFVLFLKGARFRAAHGREREFGAISKESRRQIDGASSIREAA